MVIFCDSIFTLRSFLERVLTSEDDEKEDDEEEKDEDEKNTKDTDMKLFIGKNIQRAWIIFIRGIAGKCARRSKKDV